MDYKCICGKQYNHRASLFNHKKKCNYKKQEQQALTPKEDIQKEDNKDNIINLLLKNQKDMLIEKAEMKEMFVMFFKSQLESQSNTNTMITGLHENQANMTNKIIQEVIKEVWLLKIMKL